MLSGIICFIAGFLASKFFSYLLRPKTGFDSYFKKKMKSSTFAEEYNKSLNKIKNIDRCVSEEAIAYSQMTDDEKQSIKISKEELIKAQEESHKAMKDIMKKVSHRVKFWG